MPYYAGSWRRNNGTGSSSRFFEASSRGGRGDRDTWNGNGSNSRSSHSAGYGPKLLVPALSDLAADRTDRDFEVYVTPSPPLKEAPSVEAIPLSYGSPQAYLRAMQQHGEAEYYAAVQQGRGEAVRSPTGSWLHYTVASGPIGGAGGEDRPYLHVQGADFETDPWSRHMVELEGHGTALLVTFCKALEKDEKAEDCSGQLVVRGMAGLGGGRGRLRSLGYVGSYLIEYQSAEQLLQEPPSAGTAAAQLLRMVSAPTEANRQATLSTLAAGGPGCQLGSAVPCNQAQAAAVRGLRPGLDVIHGPPGSGKSTTIWHLINSRVGQHRKCLVTCSRNQAVNAVVEKVASFGCLVFGSEARLGEAARGYTLAGRLKADPEMLRWRRVDDRVASVQKGVQACSFDSWWGGEARRCFPGLKRLEGKEAAEVEAAEQRRRRGSAPKLSRSAAGLWLTALRAVMERRYAGRWTGAEARRLRLWGRLADRAASKLFSRILPDVTVIRRRHIVATARVLLCTIDSSARMVQSLEEAVGAQAAAALKVDTCVVDEAGCVLESSIPVILRWEPANIVLVGDHCQLQPFSHLQTPHGRPETQHSRSLLERAVDAGLKPWLLSIQYRMPDRLSRLVSRLFYCGRLATAPALLGRAGEPPEPCRWVDVDGEEVAHLGKGYSNPAEVRAVVAEVHAALRDARNAVVFVTTPYNKQRKALREAMEAAAAPAAALEAGRLQVLSVDACQGSEADCVVLSLVRSAEVNAFLEDRRRMCVALSRARRECVVVGSADNFRRRGSSMWQQVTAHFKRQEPSSAAEDGLAGLRLF